MSGRFGVPGQFKLTAAGDVFFTSGGNTGLFRWSQAAGLERLLQTNDPLEKLGISGTPQGLFDSVGTLLQANAGYVAFIASAAVKGGEEGRGLFVYDGSSFRSVKVGVNTFFEPMVNASGRVAVRGWQGYWSPSAPQQIVVETAASGGRGVAVAQVNQPAPGTGGGTYRELLKLIGFNDAGHVAFLANVAGGNTNAALFLFDGTEVRLVAKTGPANGDFFEVVPNSTNGVSYALNNNGKLAIRANRRDEGQGIWIADASGGLKRLLIGGEDTGVPGFGACSSSPLLRGFDDSDRVLYDCNTRSGPRYALFLKSLADPAPKVIFKRGQSGGPAGTFDTLQQASLNNAGSVAFLATLKGGSSPMGWYLAAGDADPVKIAIEGESAPRGGTFGLAGRDSAAVLNASNQVLFLADLLKLNAVGLFSWTSEGGVTTVVSTNDPLPDGANTVLRAEPGERSDTESLVRVLKAGGQATFYAAPLEPGMSGLRKIVADFDQVPKSGTVVGPDSLSMNGKGEVVFTAALLGSDSYPRAGILASLPDSGMKTAVLTGDAAPGGGTITSFDALQLNNQSQVAFFAGTTVGTTAGQGIFLASLEPPSLQKVVRTGDSGPAVTFSALDSSLSLNDLGQVAFLGTATNPWRIGIFVGSADGAPLKVVEGSDPAPSGTFDNTNIYTPFKLNKAGQVAFVANYNNSSGRGVFLGSTTSSPRAIATAGSIAPGAGSVTFGDFTPASLDLNSSGQVAFYARLNSTASVRGGWFLGSATAPLSSRLLWQQSLPGGGPAAIAAVGARFAALADSGEMAIYVSGVVFTNQGPQIVIAGADGTLRKFATAAETAEGTGGEFAKLYPTLTATPSGRFLFGAVLLNGPAQAGVFIDKP